MHYRFIPRGVCARSAEFDLDENGKISNLSFRGGCAGNLQAIGKLLEGNTCGPRPTSCADQLTKGLRAALDGELQPVEE